ncbi:Arm DNA-binding domain-containing protein [Methylosarcina fibrata]|uniref:Arm DNA-binding domain-containing protein n=1 Tax=Methylosarcina fibrata TaxID=105972 RepID=UPI0038BA925B
MTSTGFNYFRLKYRFGGKEKVLALDTYPEINLELTRKNGIDPIHEQIITGIDPALPGISKMLIIQKRCPP